MKILILWRLYLVKLKFMKKVIAVLCAIVMTTSCATASVGAVKEGYGVSSEDERKCIDDIDEKIRLSINTIEEMMEKFKNIKEKRKYIYTTCSLEDIYTIWSNLNDTKNLLKSTVNLELVGLGRIKAIKQILDDDVISCIKKMNEYFSKYSNDPEGLLIHLYNDCDHLKCDVDKVVVYAKRLNEPSIKYRKLDKTKRLIEQINSPEEKTRLTKLCEDAEDDYIEIIQGEFYYEELKDNLVNLANGAISEINKAFDSQKEEEKKREDETKNREREEKIKQAEAEAKKQE